MGGGGRISKKPKSERKREGYSYRGAPQASNSGGEMGILSFFFLFPSLLFSSPRPRHFIPLRLRALLSSRGVRPVHSVVLGLPPAFHLLPPPFPTPSLPPVLAFHPIRLFSFHPGRVVLVTFRLAVRDRVRSLCESLFFFSSVICPVLSPLFRARCSIQLPRCAFR